MPQVYRELDAGRRRGLKRFRLGWSIDLHVYVLLLLRALHEPLRQRSLHLRFNDHTMI